MDSANANVTVPQQTSIAVDNEMNIYTNETSSPAPVLGNLQTVLSTVSTGSPTQAQAQAQGQPATASPTSQLKVQQHDATSQILTRPRLQELVREIDATEQLDEEVEEILLQIADDFVEQTVTSACQLAKHRGASTIDVKDVQLHLERNWNMWIPGFGTDELRPYKRSSVTEAHKQRLALIRKTLKKY